MSFPLKKAIVVGGSRGLGLGIVEALVGKGIDVTAVARGRTALNDLADRLGVSTLTGDAADPATVTTALANKPDLVILNAGTVPTMDRIDRIGWEDFSKTWNSDVKAALHWTQGALNLPLAPGSLVLLTSSGASVAGSPLSGGYAPAKRASWYIARYADALARKQGLDIRFRVAAPRQMVEGTGIGDAGMAAYAAAAGKTPKDIAADFPSMPPQDYGSKLIDLIETGMHDGLVYALRGGADTTVLDPLPA